MDESLIILAEECAEVQQVISKILRFGPEEANIKNLEEEIGDIIAMMTIISHHGIIDSDMVMNRVPIKLKKLKKYSNIKDLDSIIENI